MRSESPASTGLDVGIATAARTAAAPALRRGSRSPREVAAEVATVLAGMSYVERVRAYRSGALTAHELAVAAGWFPEEMPLLNGEFEWIAISSVDLE
ncbi:MAG TPA: hypothetical protein VHZ54_10610 [Solirubrobacterales bacterium]|jgi:hypothetical protein|nr:hypothetical protein [Solirubrobacterales bacterium]